jgi:hypothetical protein
MDLNNRVVIDYDPTLGRTTYARRVEEADRKGWEIWVDYEVDPTIEANKIELNNQASGWKGDLHKIASLSPGIAYGQGYIAQALKEGDEKAMSKWLNDSDNRAWRTKEGKV